MNLSLKSTKFLFAKKINEMNVMGRRLRSLFVKNEKGHPRVPIGKVGMLSS
jgi:hypothetical protein